MSMSAPSLAIPTLLIAGAAGAVAWLLIAEPPPVPEPEPSVPPGSYSLRTDTRVLQEPVPLPDGMAAGPAPLPQAIRNVSPEGVSAPIITAPLTRIEPSKRYLELKDPPIAPIPDGPLELKRVQVVDAGTLRTKDLTVRIAHVKALAADETCVSRLGGTWPCGARARTSLRGLIRIFTITCEKVADLGPREISAICHRRKTDIGAWLVEHGWAEPLEDAPAAYKELATAAQEKKIGKWQAEWLEVPLGAANSAETQEIDLDGLLPEGSDPESWLGADEPTNPFDLPADSDIGAGFGNSTPTVDQGLLPPLPGSN
ncbi:thermonuclease family protein [Roseibium sp.]|uniref:thermonuclease family protein n=1 Tax=Roseibium sp. TaxID=1936156 RepID=UPI003A982017